MVTVRMEANNAIKSLQGMVKNLPKELSTVSWKTAKKGKSVIAKTVTQELNTTQRNAKKLIHVEKTGRTGATVRLDKTRRPPLRDFKARQIRAGVKAKISKTAGAKLYAGAFQGPSPKIRNPKWNGRVFKRIGKSRLVQLHGVSPWGVLKASKSRRDSIRTQLEAELRKQLVERVRYRRLKQSGTI